MRRREARRLRGREDLPPTLGGLVKLIPTGVDTRRFLQETYGTMAPLAGQTGAATATDDVGEQEAIITGEGLEKLLQTLGDACPEGAMDLVRVARRAPRSQSTAERIQIPELCFALSQVMGPVGVHERRRAAGEQMTPVDEETPLLQYYKGRRFRAIIHGEDPSSPAARAEAAEASGKPEEDPVAAQEWTAFMKSVSTPLPMTLRVHKTEKVPEQVALRMLGEPRMREVVKPVAALPESTQVFSCTNADYHSHPTVEYICRTLHTASAVSFQEVVSTIPVLALGVEPQHRVLDMCAAPGSKTLQALDEMLRKGWDVPDLRKGVLIANEKDRVKATQTLPGRLKRFHAPHVMCTRCDAVQWPHLFVTEGGALGQYKNDASSCPIEQRFDRIICDVPCSGDGTIRKEASVAATWSGGYVKSLVPTQKALLRRGLDLLADDGILVYSTCSINPKEDEEVVCAGLELFGDAVELLDVNAILAERGASLHSTGGILTPNVESLRQPVVPSGFDGTKVLRVLPHRDDTGGFFVAAFRKKRQIESSLPAVFRQKLNQWTKWKVWAPVAKDDPVWTNIARFYGFDHLEEKSFSYYPDSCVNEKNAQGLVPVYHLNPHGGPTRRIVLATPALASMIFGTRLYKGPGVELVCVGARAFEIYDGNFLPKAECRWRSVMESASFIASRASKRKMRFSAEKHRQMLEELLRNGYVYMRKYWRDILCDPAVSALNTSTESVAPYPFVLDGSLRALLSTPHSATPEAETEIASKVEDLLSSELRVGGILLGLSRGSDPEEAPWFLSATLSGYKLELAVDASLRTYALMAYLDVFENCEKATNTLPPRPASDASPADGEEEKEARASPLGEGTDEGTKEKEL